MEFLIYLKTCQEIHPKKRKTYVPNNEELLIMDFPIIILTLTYKLPYSDSKVSVNNIIVDYYDIMGMKVKFYPGKNISVISFNF